MINTLFTAITLSLCLWIPQYSFSQDGLPRVVVLDGDTGVFISPAQLDTANAVRVDLDECRQVRDSLVKTVHRRDAVIFMQDSLNLGLNSELSLSKQRLDDKDGLLQIERKDARRKKWAKWALFGIGILVGRLSF
jgi:hypothetical protein